MTLSRPNQRLRSTRILIVEDQSLVALDLALIVEDEGGHVVGPLQRIEEAWGLSRLHDLDAAILDIDIRGRDIFPIAARLTSAKVPVVFHTGRSDVDQALNRYPTARILRKPSTAPQIVAALVRAISSGQASAAAS